MQIEIPLHENNHTTTINLDPIIPCAGTDVDALIKTSYVSCAGSGNIAYKFYGKHRDGYEKIVTYDFGISSGKHLNYDSSVNLGDNYGSNQTYCIDKIEVVYTADEKYLPCLSELEGFTAKMNFYIELRLLSQTDPFLLVP